MIYNISTITSNFHNIISIKGIKKIKEVCLNNNKRKKRSKYIFFNEFNKLITLYNFLTLIYVLIRMQRDSSACHKLHLNRIATTKRQILLQKH